MSIPSDSLWRGCAANFAQPVEEQDLLAAQNLVQTVYYSNCRIAFPPLLDIIYRSSYGDQDVTRHVFRWDTTPYEQVFENGFHAKRQEGTKDITYFDLNHYVHHGARPLDSTKPATHAFLSTTLNSNWYPSLTLQSGEEIQVYRYEIYAPGGIWVAESLGNQVQYPAQDEVCFVSGIALQYIRSAQLFIASRKVGSQNVQWRRADNILIVNGHFNPQSHPLSLLNIQMPVFDYVAENGTHTPLTINIYGSQLRPCQSGNDATDWYAGKVADICSYINAAFRSSRTNEAYLFMKNEYALLNYAPGTTDDKIVDGPRLICDGFPSLIGTAFGEHGIDSAFDTDGDKAFIFSGNLCAYIDYAPATKISKILSGPMTITAMFPFFNRTVFENGIDTAFRSSRSTEAYLFKGDQYALINYDSKNLIAMGDIIQGFKCLEGTIFESGIDASFASHMKDEAYLFKGDQYTRIKFAPETNDNQIIGGVKGILPYWPSLSGVLPRKNRGLDVRSLAIQPHTDQDHNQL